MLKVNVKGIRREARNILSYELVAADGGPLPAFSAGAHIGVQVTDALRRDYSLCNAPRERHRYVIAVLKEQDGEGGSAAMHDRIQVGEVLTITEPTNLFPLAEEARSHLLLAGGIGVTPLMAMAEALNDDGARWHMHYCTRDPAATAFRDRLEPWIEAGRVTLHHDGGNPERGLDIAALLARHEPGRHVYFCGPPGFMAAVQKAVADWPEDHCHSEYFVAPEEAGESAAPDQETDRSFQVKIASTGAILDVPADRSIVQVLWDNGFDIETSCEEGFCGTCITRYTGGEPEHRDVVLNEKSRRNYVMVCCARAKRSPLVLDL